MQTIVSIHFRLIALAVLLPASALLADDWDAIAAARAANVQNQLLNKAFTAKDSLAPDDDPSADARQCLDGLCWTPTSFDVRCEPSPDARFGDLTVRFRSPIASGSRRNDVVAAEWYVAFDEDGRLVEAPAIVVVHESNGRMTVGRQFAKALRHQGFHTFLVYLPHYGTRRGPNGRPQDASLFTAFRQGIADVRRARDAISVLPLVDSSHIALQGTSLGGIVSATTAGIDHAFDSVHLMLAGGDLGSILNEGDRDAARVRQMLKNAGLSDDQIVELAKSVEPTRLAHRVEPNSTWLFSATQDRVIPLANANALAAAAHLDAEHHIKFYANHYSGFVYFPVVIGQIATHISDLRAASSERRASQADRTE